MASYDYQDMFDNYMYSDGYMYYIYTGDMYDASENAYRQCFKVVRIYAVIYI